MRGRSAAALVAVALCAGIYTGTPVNVHAAFASGTIITDTGSAGSGTAINLGQLPFALAVNGPDLYVGDLANPVLRDVTGAAEAALAGNDGYGYLGDGGPATAAMINGAGAIAQCGTDLYFSDTFNYVIRKIDRTTGIITTVVGNGTFGSSGLGGSGTSAQIGRVFGISCIPGSTGIYFSDSDFGAVRRLISGTIDTYATGAAFPTNLMAAGSGDLYISDSGANVVWRIDGMFLTASIFAGNGVAGYSGDNGPARSAQLSDPRGLAITHIVGSVFGCQCFISIADRANEVVRTVDDHGVISTLAGIPGIAGFSGDGGQATAAKLFNPYGLASDGTDVTNAGAVYVADYSNYRVRKIDMMSRIITTVAGNGTPSWSGDGGQSNIAQIGNPVGVAFDAAGNQYISDNQDSVVRKITPLGVITTVAGTAGKPSFSGDTMLATAATLSNPTGMALNSSGDIFIADTANQRVRRVDHVTGIISTLAGNGTAAFAGDAGPATSAALNSPSALAADGAGNVYIADTANNRVRKVTSGGTISTYAGDGTAAFGGDNGLASAAQINGPLGLALDSSGNLFISDSGNNRIRRIDHTSLMITTVAGNGTAGLGGDNNAANVAELNHPYGLAVDTSGRIYIADTRNQRIRLVDTSGIISSVVATCGVTTGFSGDNGQAALARLNTPLGLAVNGTQLFIADVNNNRMRRVFDVAGLRIPLCPSATTTPAADRVVSAAPSTLPAKPRIPWIERPASGLIGLGTGLRITAAAPPAVAPEAATAQRPRPAAVVPRATQHAVAAPAAAGSAVPEADVRPTAIRRAGAIVAPSRPVAARSENPSYLPVVVIALAMIAVELLAVRRRKNRRLIGHTTP